MSQRCVREFVDNAGNSSQLWGIAIVPSRDFLRARFLLLMELMELMELQELSTTDCGTQ